MLIDIPHGCLLSQIIGATPKNGGNEDSIEESLFGKGLSHLNCGNGLVPSIPYV